MCTLCIQIYVYMNVSRPFVRVSADGLWRSERTTNQKIEKNGLSSRSLITIGKARALSLFLALSRSVSFCFSRSFSFRLFLKSRYIYLILFSFAFHGNFTILSCINILIRFSFFPFQIECSRSFSRRPTRFSCSLSLSLATTSMDSAVFMFVWFCFIIIWCWSVTFITRRQIIIIC